MEEKTFRHHLALKYFHRKNKALASVNTKFCLVMHTLTTSELSLDLKAALLARDA